MSNPPETLTVEPPGQSAEDTAGQAVTFTRGACLGRYVVLGSIGSGGMGDIFSAYDPELDRKVAIKILHRRVLTSEARDVAQARLRREARAVAKLAHPNVVSIYDVGTVGECLFVAMELIAGQSLAEWLEQTQPPWQRIVETFEQAGRGLAAAHRAGLVHRDFKPSNVMLAADGRVRVVDFGLARSLDPQPAEAAAVGARQEAAGSPPPDLPGSAAWTRTGLVQGTPAYMAPEQQKGQKVDARADQYSFCVALFQALYGELPSADVTQEATPSPAADKAPEAPRGRVPATVRQVLLRGLQPDPDDRYPTMDALLADLAVDPSRRRRQLIGLAATLLTAVALVLLWPRDELLCTGAERRLAGIWDVPRQTAIERIFLASERVYTKDLWSSVRRSLDDYTGIWQNQHTEVCEATHLRGEQSLEMLDRQMACLDQRLVELREVTNLFLHGEGKILQNPLDAVGSLGRLELCADRAALLGLPAPPSSEERRRQESIRAKLAQAKALEAAADYPQAANLAQQALEEAEALEAIPLIGEARYRLASGLGRQGQFAELRRNSLQAARIAMAARDDDLLARALTRMIIASWVRADTEDALEWSQLAAAAIERLGGRNDLEAIRRQFLCMLGYQSRQYETAADHCRAALEIDPGMPPQRRALVLNNLGNAQSGLGHLDAALATYRESMALDEQLYGREHPAYATTLGNIGNILGKRCELIEAQAHHEQALAIKERTEGPDNPNIVVQLLNVGLLLADRGLYPEGVPYLERALRFEPDDPHLLADIQFHLARALWGSGGDRQRALRLAGTALEAFESLGEVYARETAEATDWLAERRDS